MFNLAERRPQWRIATGGPGICPTVVVLTKLSTLSRLTSPQDHSSPARLVMSTLSVWNGVRHPRLGSLHHHLPQPVGRLGRRICRVPCDKDDDALLLEASGRARPNLDCDRRGKASIVDEGSDVARS